MPTYQPPNKPRYATGHVLITNDPTSILSKLKLDTETELEPDCETGLNNRPSQPSSNDEILGKPRRMTSVDRLRDQCIAQSQRPFLARGASLQRCPLCLLANHWCICQSQPEPSKDAAVALVFYQGEIFKPSNSGRLIADCMDENHAFLWQRRDCPKEFKHLIQRPDLQPFVIFPSEYSTPERCVQDKQSYDQLLGDRKPLFIFLDGSWREARKMFRGHWFDDLPVLSLFQQQLASYQLRRAVHDFQLGTADVATHIFRQLELTTLADRLDTYSQLVQQRYLAGKRNLLPNPTSDV